MACRKIQIIRLVHNIFPQPNRFPYIVNETLNPKKMKIKRAGFYLVILSFFVFSCQQTDQSISIVTTDNGPLNQIDVRSITDSIQLKLTDIAKNFEIIKLETTKESLIKQPRFYVGKEYIICICENNRVLQFSRSGKFINEIVKKGKGPNEIIDASLGIDDRINSSLYIVDAYKSDYILQYDLQSGQFLDPIKLKYPGRYGSIQVIDEKTLLCSPVMGASGEASEHKLIWQKMNGEVPHTLPDLVSNRRWVQLGAKTMHKVGQTVKYRPESDTLYIVDNQTLKPE